MNAYKVSSVKKDNGSSINKLQWRPFVLCYCNLITWSNWREECFFCVLSIILDLHIIIIDIIKHKLYPLKNNHTTYDTIIINSKYSTHLQNSSALVWPEIIHQYRTFTFIIIMGFVWDINIIKYWANFGV